MVSDILQAHILCPFQGENIDLLNKCIYQKVILLEIFLFQSILTLFTFSIWVTFDVIVVGWTKQQTLW